MHFNILTLFPDMFPGVLGQSLSGKALENQTWSYNAINIRDFADDVHKSVDDAPYGGGAGMIMRPDVIEKALISQKSAKNIYLSPRGKSLTQEKVKDLTNLTELTLLCGRYEGIDQRVLDAHNFEEISIGDYVLSGGEPAALVLMDACIRLLPGVMGNDQTANEESFSNGLLEYPHYTRPAEWIDAHGKKHIVPDILKNGHHEYIKQWRYDQSIAITRKNRPDLLRTIKRETAD